MATTPQTVYETGPVTDLQEKARRHLWMHFTRMGAYDEGHEIPIITRGEGSYVYDEHGKRYLDGLSALFCVNAGHGRTEIGEAAAAQVKELGFYTNWSYAHPKAIELASRDRGARAGRPQPRLLHVGRLRGRRVGLEALAPVPQAHRQPPEDEDHLARDRLPRHHLRRALDHRDHAAAHARSSRSCPARITSRTRTSYRWPEQRDPLWAADAIEHMIEFQGPETVAAVILEPVQNSGGCFVPQDGYWQRVREICDKHNVLLISDEVICSWGRLGHYFGVERFGVVPDMITTAKGLTSAYAPMGGVIVSDRVSEPFMQRHEELHARHHVRRPPGLRGDGARQPRHLRARGPAAGTCARRSRSSAACSTSSQEDLPIVGDVRGAGYFHALELVKDKETKESFSDEEGEELLRGFMSGELYKHGLICRADDRGDPVIQLSPPLIADSEEFELIDRVLRQVLTEAWERIVRH